MATDQRITFAAAADGEKLREILAPYELGLPGEPEDHLTARENGAVRAAAMLAEMEPGHFYLYVLGAAERGRGYGGLLLREILACPWRCCRRPLTNHAGQPDFCVTVIARGEARLFYERHGFTVCGFADIPEQFREQCDLCPSAADCDAQPMIFRSGAA
jgi:GNAT superfamily N-acetyltransferase